MPTMFSSPAAKNAAPGDSAVSQQSRPHFLGYPDPADDVLGGCDRGHLHDPDDVIAPAPRWERGERIAIARLLEGYQSHFDAEWFFDERRRLIFWAVTSTELVSGPVEPPLTVARLNARRVFRVIEKSGLWTFAGSAAHELRECVWAGEAEPNTFPGGNLKSYARRRTLSTLGDWLSRASRNVFTPVDEIVHAIRETLQEVAE